jgi:hypothetical protein
MFGMLKTVLVFNVIRKALGAVMNAIIDFGLGFVNTFEWGKAGKFIADNINKAVSDIKWAELGQLLSDFMKGALLFLYTAISETDWYALGESVKT